MCNESSNSNRVASTRRKRSWRSIVTSRQSPLRSKADHRQTAINPIVGLELLARGTWSGAGVLGPEAFAPKPFLELLVEYGSPWGMREEAVAG